MVAGGSVGIDCSSSSARVAGSSVLGTRELATPVVWFWSSAVGIWADSGGSVVVPTGVSGTGATNTSNVWGLVDNDQTPSWSTISTSQTPSWSEVSTTQTPDWEEVA